MIGIIGTTKACQSTSLMLDEIEHRGSKTSILSLGDTSFGICANKKNKIFKKDGYVILVDGTLEYNGNKKCEEYILSLYKKYKNKTFAKLKGTFALCIYDIKKDSFVLARDKMGIKPLYYIEKNFSFASEIKALLKNELYEKVLNKELIADYFLYQTNPDRETLFKGIYKVEPGSFITYENGKIEVNKYYDFSFDNLVYDEDEIKNRLKANVNKYFNFDRKNVASFLSSGIDSSLITSVFKPKDTYTVSYDDEKYSESNQTSELARILKINNHIRSVNKEEFLKVIQDIQYAMDEPCLDPAVVALYFGAKSVSEKYDYVCSGEGADELFAGYNSYFEMYKYQSLNNLPKVIRKPISVISQKLPEFKGVNFLIRRTTALNECYAGVSRIFNTQTLNKLLKVKGNNIIKYNYMMKEKYDNLQKMQSVDINYWLKEEIHATERMCAFNGVEALMPYLNDEIIDIAKIVPSSYKLNNNRTKAILRDVAKDFIPNNTYQNKKLGFPVPIRKWLRTKEYYEEIKNIFNSEEAKAFFDVNLINKWLDSHYEGKKDYTKHIWSCYTFLIWYRRFFQ